MLKVETAFASEIESWETSGFHKQVLFKIHQPDLFHFFEEQNSITLFYGFLDMQQGLKNPAEYASRQINKSGQDGLSALYGSFIIFHFDKVKSSLIISSDIMGDFLVSYYVVDDEVYVSDFPEALLNNKNNNINEKRLPDYFALTQTQIQGSFFENINQLPPRYILYLNNSDIEERAYYRPDSEVDFNSSNINELSEAFKQLMMQVINFQTHGEEHVGVSMSGGMDSTFIAMNSLICGKKTSTFSYTFPEMPQADESIWLDSLRTQGFDMHTFSGINSWPLKQQWPVSLNSPSSNPYRHLKSSVYGAANSKNIKYLLTGVFADHLYSGNIYWLVDMLKHQPLKAINTLYNFIKANGLRLLFKQISPAKWSHKAKITAPWMTEPALQQVINQNQSKASSGHSHPIQYDLVYGLSTAQSCWLENEYAFNNNIYIRHPFRDRRIIEFMMSLPASILGEPGHRKKLIKYTAKSLLPATILNRKQLTTLEPFYRKGVLDKEIESVRAILTDSSCNWSEYVNENIVLEILKNPQSKFKESHYMILWQCLSYELWKSRLAGVK